VNISASLLKEEESPSFIINREKTLRKTEKGVFLRGHLTCKRKKKELYGNKGEKR